MRTQRHRHVEFVTMQRQPGATLPLGRFGTTAKTQIPGTERDDLTAKPAQTLKASWSTLHLGRFGTKAKTKFPGAERDDLTAKPPNP